MKQARAALRYAKALLNLAIDNKVEDKVNDQMKSIATTIADSTELDQLLKSPVTKSEDKAKVLNALFTDSDAITKGLFNLLKENKRMDLLETVARKYNIIFDAYKSSQVATVTTTVPLTKELEDKIQAKIVSLTGNNATIENIINPDILGGFILKVGDKQFDASIASKFQNLRKEFDNSHYQAKI